SACEALLVDAAGEDDAVDPLEQQMQEAARYARERATIVLRCAAVGGSVGEAVSATVGEAVGEAVARARGVDAGATTGRPVTEILVGTKSDLGAPVPPGAI